MPVRQGATMATFAEQMVTKYETLLQTSAGLDTVSVDGQSVHPTYWATGPGDPPRKGRRAQRLHAQRLVDRPEQHGKIPGLAGATSSVGRAADS
jgi:hypothetical protein